MSDLKAKYQELVGDNASEKDFENMLDWVKQKGIVAPSDPEAADDFYTNVVNAWLELMSRVVALLSRLPRDLSDKNLTEKQYAKLFKSGEILKAIPDPSHRIKFIYSDGARQGFITRTDGGIKIYKSEPQCWDVINKLECRS